MIEAGVAKAAELTKARASAEMIKRMCISGQFQVACHFLAALIHDVVADLLVLIEALQPGSLHGSDVDERVLAATALKVNEAATLVSPEPLHGAGRRYQSSLLVELDTTNKPIWSFKLPASARQTPLMIRAILLATALCCTWSAVVLHGGPHPEIRTSYAASR